MSSLSEDLQEFSHKENTAIAQPLDQVNIYSLWGYWRDNNTIPTQPLQISSSAHQSLISRSAPGAQDLPLLKISLTKRAVQSSGEDY